MSGLESRNLCHQRLTIRPSSPFSILHPGIDAIMDERPIKNPETDAVKPSQGEEGGFQSSGNPPVKGDSEEKPMNGEDDNEIELDEDDNDHDTESRRVTDKLETKTRDESSETPAETSNLGATSSSSIRDRLRLLKQKMNQARTLNQQAVQEEGQRAQQGASTTKKSKIKAAKLDPLTQQVASHVLHDAQQAAEKEALNQFSVNDYHNPQGQFRNYQRNLQSLPSQQRPMNDNTSTFDPTTDSHNSLSAAAEREGARAMAKEMHRRIEKKQKRELKRKEKEMEQGDGDVSYINQRNKRFNQKINRTYDEATAEIRQNLERGTAL